MTMAGRTDRDSGVTVEKNVSINIPDPHAGATFGDQLEVRSRISGIDELGVGFDDRAALRAGQLSPDFGFLWCDCGCHHLFTPCRERPTKTLLEVPGRRQIR